MRKFLYMVAAMMLLLAGPASAVSAPVCVAGTGPWTQTWATSTVSASAVGPWSNMTLRMVAHTSIGGSQVRIHLSNEFATSTVTFGHVSVAQQLDGAIAAAAPTSVTFAGATSVTLAPGAEVASDAVSFPTTPGERLLVSVFLPPGDGVTSAPVHTYAGETEFNIVNTDGSMMTSPPVNNTFGFSSYLAGVDVDSSSANTVVAIGDSITDLADVPNDADTRWTDYLAHRTGLAVVNEGISGNWVTNGSGTGQSVTARFQHDVVGVTGVRSVIDAGGINDLRAGVSVATLESAQASLVASAHAAGIRILMSTITPCAGDPACTSGFESARQAYNAWVLAGSSGADAVVNFASAVGNGAALAGMYTTNSPLHPNSAGMLAMANAVDPSQL